VVLCLGHLGHLIHDFVQDGTQFGLTVLYSQDGNTPLGTAGAIKKALPLLEHSFFVIYGDSYLDCNYFSVQQAFIRANKLSLMTVFKNKNYIDSSNVEFSLNKIIHYDKQTPTSAMLHIDYGLGVFKCSAFASISANSQYDLANLYQHLLAEQQLSGFEVFRRCYEIGSRNGLIDTENFLLEVKLNGKAENDMG
jgi:N-acetyl-alpha-D-muramate 1-phosphate uridylyltransferase